MRKWAAVWAPALALPLSGIPAAPADQPATYALIFENDLFYRTDRDYTNGHRIRLEPGGRRRIHPAAFPRPVELRRFSA